MRWETREIAWHDTKAIHSVTLQPCINRTKDSSPTKCWRLATGGITTDIKIWDIVMQKLGEDHIFSIEFVSELRRHDFPVNCVRFSPDGELLATADSENLILLWKKSEYSAPDIFADEDALPNKETWLVHKSLRGHLSEVFEFAWSPDCQTLVSASFDRTLIIWDTVKGMVVQHLREFKQYPQGVTFDPLGKYIMALGTDRCMRVYAQKSNAAGCTKWRCIYNVSKSAAIGARKPECKRTEPNEGDVEVSVPPARLFHDDSILCVYRRPCFSPDGELVVAPCGCYEQGTKTINASYVFSRHNFSKPLLVLPCPEKPTFAAAFCPVFFECNVEEENRIFKSSDGKVLCVSSKDGYVTMLAFEENEFGNRLVERPPIPVVDIKPVKELVKEISVEQPTVEVVKVVEPKKALPKKVVQGPSIEPPKQILAPVLANVKYLVDDVVSSLSPSKLKVINEANQAKIKTAFKNMEIAAPEVNNSDSIEVIGECLSAGQKNANEKLEPKVVPTVKSITSFFPKKVADSGENLSVNVDSSNTKLGAPKRVLLTTISPKPVCAPVLNETKNKSFITGFMDPKYVSAKCDDVIMTEDDDCAVEFSDLVSSTSEAVTVTDNPVVISKPPKRAPLTTLSSKRH